MSGWKVLGLEPLGQGGFGDLYVGLRSDNGEKVVVKFLREKHLHGARKLFEREIRILGRKIHHGIVEILGFNLEAERPYYIMPYLPGGSASSSAGQYDSLELQWLAMQISEAIEALHRADIAHGDIKPDNILLDGREPLLSDPLGNGAGCTLSLHTQWGGTPGYWAPEVSEGGAISKRGDVYSFGATMFHLATGVVPEDGMCLDIAPWRPDDEVLRYVILSACNADPDSRPTISSVRAMLLGMTAAEGVAFLAKAAADYFSTPRGKEVGTVLLVGGAVALGVAGIAAMMRR
ncbi:MAG: serine/threonine protein kinase [Myxococcales bacterium]|nr:serine/threonine protein kinase [Myxococcales bacterium]